MQARRGLAACLTVAALLLSGCAGKQTGTAGDELEGEPDQPLPGDPSYNPGYVSKSGGFVEGEAVSFYCDTVANSTVKVDVNRTFSGSVHSHDMWQGEDAKVIFDGEVTEFVQGDYFTMPGAVVYPGAGRAEFKATWDPLAAGDWRQLGVNLPGIKINTTDVFSDYVLNFTTPGQVHAIDFTFAQNDRPHAERTTWTFKSTPYSSTSAAVGAPTPAVSSAFRSVGSALDQQRMTLTWTIFRTYDCLPLDPPHYDVWGSATERLIVDTTTTHDQRNVPLSPAGAFYGLHRAEAPFLNIVPPGTGTIVMELTWHPQDAVPTKLGLLYSTAASNLGSLTTDWQEPAPKTDQTNRRLYQAEVHPLEADSPYANKTGWDFNFYIESFGPAETRPYGKFTGTIDWKVTAYRVGFGPSS